MVGAGNLFAGAGGWSGRETHDRQDPHHAFARPLFRHHLNAHFQVFLLNLDEPRAFLRISIVQRLQQSPLSADFREVEMPLPDPGMRSFTFWPDFALNSSTLPFHGNVTDSERRQRDGVSLAFQLGHVAKAL